MGLRGSLSSIKALKANLRRLPVSVAHDVARRASPAMTDLSQTAFDTGQTVYGKARPRGVDGQPLDLVRTGRTRSYLTFTTTGTVVRAVLGTKWAKYLIGKYDILPNGPMPKKWRERLTEIVKAQKVSL